MSQQFKVGQRVRCVGGPFPYEVGRVVGFMPGGRVKVEYLTRHIYYAVPGQVMDENSITGRPDKGERPRFGYFRQTEGE